MNPSPKDTGKPRYWGIKAAGMTVTEIHGAAVAPYVVDADEVEAFIQATRKQVDDFRLDKDLTIDALADKVEKLEAMLSCAESEAALTADSFHANDLKITELERKLAKAVERYEWVCKKFYVQSAAEFRIADLKAELESVK
jgi:thymidine kinase